MQTHISFPSIEQYRNTCFDVISRATYTGHDENNEPVYDTTLAKPTLEFEGSVKLHGRNASVCYNQTDGLWTQSREAIITVAQDNAGFARFVSENEPVFMELIECLYQNNVIPDRNTSVALFGEWCGSGVQRGVGISSLPKSFFIFAAKMVEGDKETWLNTMGLRAPESRIYNILDYPTYKMVIDFNDPGAVSDYMTELTTAVEAECPVASAFGIKGTGEGIVWKTFWEDELYIFKIKGEKHAPTKVKDMASPVVSAVAGVAEFVENTVTEARFNQAVEKVCGGPEMADPRKMGDVLKWMAADIQKEESDTLAESGLAFKDVAKGINEKTRAMFLALCNLNTA
jgi:hypothetical protein